MYVSLQFKLQLDSSDRKKLLELMRKQSSAIRSAYKLLKTKNSHSQIYQKLRQLFPDLPTKYIDSAIYKAKQYPIDKKVVLGEEKVSSLRGWGDGPMWDFSNSLREELIEKHTFS
ncbi:hypothetical protein [Thermocrinis sp.]|uniref:hypothetical protein n=1 Tax=Thermocrinis sp. TaxID=2024383 RepID=UPI002FDE86F0